MDQYSKKEPKIIDEYEILFKQKADLLVADTNKHKVVEVNEEQRQKAHKIMFIKLAKDDLRKCLTYSYFEN